MTTTYYTSKLCNHFVGTFKSAPPPQKNDPLSIWLVQEVVLGKKESIYTVPQTSSFLQAKQITAKVLPLRWAQ